jgi:hypothetical protein
MYWLYKNYGKHFANPYGYTAENSLSLLNDNFTHAYLERIAG